MIFETFTSVKNVRLHIRVYDRANVEPYIAEYVLRDFVTHLNTLRYIRGCNSLESRIRESLAFGSGSIGYSIYQETYNHSKRVLLSIHNWELFYNKLKYNNIPIGSYGVAITPESLTAFLEADCV